MNPSTPIRDVGRCYMPTPKQSSISQSCDITEEMPSSVQSGAMPANSSSWATKRRVEFAVADGGCDASGSESKEDSDTRTSGYAKMRPRIANCKK